MKLRLELCSIARIGVKIRSAIVRHLYIIMSKGIMHGAGGPPVATMDGPGGPSLAAVHGPGGQVTARTTYGVTPRRPVPDISENTDT